ncbi:MAG: hypothetical protein JNK19_00015 [Tabrizicola sp.]|nr:hypothetical protein [Tabrizicola sp.]
MIDMRGIEYPIFAGLGAILMLCTVTPVLTVLAIFFPVLWGWVFVPVGLGAFVGMIVAVFIK